MTSFEFDDTPQHAPRASGLIWNILTALILLSTLCAFGVILAIFVNPQSALNPFPPATLPAALQFPTPTLTPRGQLPPTWTPTATPPPTATSTPGPTDTPAPTETPFYLASPAPITTTAASPASGGMPFTFNQGSPSAISSEPFHPEAACNWMGVAGQVLDIKGAPVTSGVVIQMGGLLGGRIVETITLPGTARQYGEAGYEIRLGDKPTASRNMLYIQLLDQAGLPLSDKLYFETYDDCAKNLIFITLKQVR